MSDKRTNSTYCASVTIAILLGMVPYYEQFGLRRVTHRSMTVWNGAQ